MVAMQPRRLLFTILALSAVGCGSSRLDPHDASRDAPADDHPAIDAPRDGGADAATDAAPDARSDATPDAPVLTGRQAFDVTLNLTFMPPSSASGYSAFPTTAQASVVVDATAGWLLIGGGGQGSAAMTSGTGEMRAVAAPVSLFVPVPGACSGGTLAFETLQVSVDAAGHLHGTGAGTASYITGDVGYSEKFTATLEGLPDTTPPSLLLGSVSPVDPLAPGRFAASEPLPPGTKAQLVAADGTVVDLSPDVSANASPAFITGFRLPFTLAFAASYQVAFDQLIDFAGNRAVPPAAAPLTTAPAPALLADGTFETTTGLDSGLISSTGDLPVISGTKSYYLDSAQWTGASVTFRLPVHAGDKAVRFAYRVASTYQSVGFYGAIVVGSAGATAINALSQVAAGTPTTMVTRANGTTLTLGPVSTVELALPDPGATEVVLRISNAVSGCGLPPPRSGLIIDDVRVGP
jgi:hypothetical protein